jgi:CubicO group peptidase (beta-lactamase class C family)
MIVICRVAPAAASPDDLAALVAGKTPAAPQLAGLALAVADGHGVRSRAWGAAELAADGRIVRAMAADAPVRIASVSKLVTAVAALRLAEAGTIDLDADIGRYGVVLRNPLAPAVPITLRQLLAHRSGITDGGRFTVPLGGALADIFEPGGATFSAAPGLRFDYANTNYGVVATVLEAATAERFDRLMARLVFAPLRLDAGFNWQGMSAAAIARGAALYRRQDAAGTWGGQWLAQIDAAGDRPHNGCAASAVTAGCDLAGYRPGTNGFLFSPQGGLRISIIDLARLGRALVRPARAGKPGGLLNAASLDTLFGATPTAAGIAGGETYGGLMAAYAPGAQCLIGNGRRGGDQPLAPAATAWCGHLGEAYGLTSGLWIDRASGRVIAYAVTGVGGDPAGYPGRASKFQAWEEVILAAATAPAVFTQTAKREFIATQAR